MLDQVNSIECRTWKDFLDLKHWLIHKEWIERDDSGKEIARVPLDHHIKLIVFDVVGEMFSIAEKEVVRLYNRENPTKKSDLSMRFMVVLIKGCLLVRMRWLNHIWMI